MTADAIKALWQQWTLNLTCPGDVVLIFKTHVIQVSQNVETKTIVIRGRHSESEDVITLIQTQATT